MSGAEISGWTWPLTRNPPPKNHPCLFFKGEKLNVSAECAPVLISSVLILAPPLQSRAQPLSGAAA